MEKDLWVGWPNCDHGPLKNFPSLKQACRDGHGAGHMTGNSCCRTAFRNHHRASGKEPGGDRQDGRTVMARVPLDTWVPL